MKSILAILMIGLFGLSAQAADLVRCKISSGYNARNRAGEDTGDRVTGEHICSAKPEKRSYFPNKNKRDQKIGTFREVITDKGSVWIAEKGVKTLGPIPHDVAENQQTEAGLCDGNCDKNDGSAGVSDLRAVAEEGVRPNAAAFDADHMNPLYEEYQRVQSTFLAEHPQGDRSRKSWARLWKTTFLNYLVEKMGVEKANKVIVALTAYGEGRGVSPENKWQNTAEMALVVTIIKNRASTGYRDSSNQLKSSDPALSEARVALSKAQFSVWNKNDVNLGEMMTARANIGLVRAFQAVELVNGNKIVPVGELAENNTRHFYTGTKPDWAHKSGGGHQIVAQLNTPGGVFTANGHKVYRGVR